MATSAPDRAPGHLRADARRNRARLLEVAHAAFMAGGVMASMDDIARRSGVGIGTLYRHFPTREDLVLALVADDLERLAARADELRAADAPDGVGQWLGELVQHNLTYRGLAESVLAASGQPTPLGAACDRVHAAGGALLRSAQAASTVRADIASTAALDLAAAIAWATQADTDDARRTELLRIALDGLRA